VEDALRHSRELEAVIQSSGASDYFRDMYGNDPARWSDDLEGMPRWRAITNYFTRMRFLAEDSTLDFAAKEGAEAGPEGFYPGSNTPGPIAPRLFSATGRRLRAAPRPPEYMGWTPAASTAAASPP